MTTSIAPKPSRRLSVAPMMDWTDRHCRHFHRLISQYTWLYTEMVTTGALVYGDVERHLRFNDEEHPVALQLGGSDPKILPFPPNWARSGATMRSTSIAAARRRACRRALSAPA